MRGGRGVYTVGGGIALLPKNLTAREFQAGNELPSFLAGEHIDPAIADHRGRIARANFLLPFHLQAIGPTGWSGKTLQHPIAIRASPLRPAFLSCGGGRREKKNEESSEFHDAGGSFTTFPGGVGVFKYRVRVG